MLTPREVAQGVYGEVRAMGTSNVLGIDMEVVTVARLDRTRRAERAIRAALDSERRSVREPDDDRLVAMLADVQDIARTLEGDASAFAVRGGLTDDGSF